MNNTDKEKLIKSLQNIIDSGWGSVEIDSGTVEDIITLLKERVPLEPYASEGDIKCGNGCEIVGYIRESDGKIERLANYCPYCGAPVKWD